MTETGRFAIQSLPIFLQNGPGWWLKWCHGPVEASSYHLLSQRLRSRAQMPFPPHPFAWCTSLNGHTRLNGSMQWIWLEKGKEKAGVCFPLVCVHVWGGYRCAAWSLHRLLKPARLQHPSQTHLQCSSGSTGVIKQWEERRVEMQREMVQSSNQRHLRKVPEVNWDESRPNGLCNCHNIKNQLRCILSFHL